MDRIQQLGDEGSHPTWESYQVQTETGEVTVSFFPKDGEAMIDSDVSLGPLDEVRQLLEEISRSGRRVERSALRHDSEWIWPDLTIPFRFEAGEFPTGLDESNFRTFPCVPASVPAGSRWPSTGSPGDMCTTLSDFVSALAMWENEVPGLQFIPYDPAIHIEYMEFTSVQSCSTSYPLLTHRREVQVATCGGPIPGGLASHEIGHVLGFEHEHKRYDRNLYVQDHTFADGQYDRVSAGAVDEDIPFDFGSVMLYPSFDGRTVTRTKPPDSVTSSGSTITLDILLAAWQGGLHQTEVVCGPLMHATSTLRNTPTCVTAMLPGVVGGSYDVSYKGGSFVNLITGNVAPVDSSGRPQLTTSRTAMGILASEPTSEVEDASNWSVRYQGPDFSKPQLTFPGMSTTASRLAGFGRNVTGPSVLDVSGFLKQHEGQNDDGAPVGPGEGYGSAIAHGDFDNDGVTDMAVAVPGDDGGVGSVVLYKGFVYDGTGEQGFARARVIPSVKAWSLLMFDLNDDRFDDLVVGAEWGGPGAVVVFSGNPTFDLTPTDLVEAVDPDNSGSATDFYRPDGSLYDSGNSAEFGRSLAVFSFSHGATFRAVLVVGSPNAHAYNSYSSSVTGTCLDVGGVAGMVDCEENTGAAFVYDGDLNLMEVLDPYSVGTGGNRAGADFGRAVAVGRFLGSTSCPSVAVGAPWDFEVVADPVSGAAMSANPVPGSSTHGPSSSVWLGGVPDPVGQVYLATPLVGGGGTCGPWSSSGGIVTGTQGEGLSEFGAALAAGSVVSSRSLGAADLVVGAPGASAFGDVPFPSGAVYLYEADPELFAGPATAVESPSFRLDLDWAGGVSCGAAPYDRFGEVVVVGDFEAYIGTVGTTVSANQDVAVGAPDRAQCVITDGGGAVYTFLGASGSYAAVSEYRTLASDPCSTTRGASPSDSFGSALSIQRLDRFNSAPTAFFTYPTGIVTLPFGRTDLWMGAPGADSDGSGVPGGLAQSIGGHVRYQGVADAFLCY